MSFKVLAHDDKHFLVQHPNGSQFKVAKKGLSAKVMDQIHSKLANDKALKMSDGGEVLSADDPALPNPINSSASIANDINPNPGAMPNPTHTTPTPLPTPTEEPPTPEYPNPHPSGTEMPPEPSSPELNHTVSPENQIAAQPSQDETTPRATAAPYSPQLQSAYQQQAQGVKGIAKAKSDESKAVAEAYDNEAQKLQDAKDTYEQKRDVLNTQTETLYNDALADKVDPRHYWSSKSVPNKILAGISIALGGIAGGVSGQGGNVALDIINKNINDDIEAQKANIQNKHNLLAQNLARTRDLDQAEALTRSQLLAITGAQVSKAQAQAIGPEAQANAKMLLGQLRTQAIQANSQLAILQARNTIASGGSQQINPELLPKEDRERLVQLPNGQQKLAYTAEGAKDIREQVATVQPLFNQLDQLDKLGKGALVVGSKEYNKAQAIRSNLIPLINENAGLKRLSEEDIKNISQQFKDPTSFSQVLGGAERSQQLRDFITDKLQSSFQNKLEGYKKPFRPSSATPGYIAKK